MSIHAPGTEPPDAEDDVEYETAPGAQRGMRTEFAEGKMLTIVDLNAEAEKLTTLHGVTPQATPARRAGGIARLGTYRGGLLLLGTGTSPSPGQLGHWEIHPEDELIYMLDGT